MLGDEDVGGDTGYDPQPVDVTPQQQTDPYIMDVPATGDDGGGFMDFFKALPLIGQTFASTYNTISNPSAPSAGQTPATAPATTPASYSQTQTGTDTTTPTGQSDFWSHAEEWLKDPNHVPIILGSVAALALVVVMSGGGGRGRR